MTSIENTQIGDSTKGKIILHAEKITSGYGEIEVLRDISFFVLQGEIVCLIGPNGAGKSTLLKTIFGLVPPWEGKMLFQGEDISRKRPDEILRMGISIVPQGRCNFPEMTVRENLEMGAYIRKDQMIRQDIEEVLIKFPVLRSKQRELAGNLSGGEQQVLEMASSLLLNPKIILLDEPSLGLSPIMVSKVFETILQINQEGRTIIMVEQNAKQALQIAHHAIVLELGRKRLEGTGREMLNNDDVKKSYLGQ
jgi:branched-chain amino acid transport system ATP-binding protein